jgi:hypothetical protein
MSTASRQDTPTYRVGVDIGVVFIAAAETHGRQRGAAVARGARAARANLQTTSSRSCGTKRIERANV